MVSVDVETRGKIFHLDRNMRAYREGEMFSMCPSREIVTALGSLDTISRSQGMRRETQSERKQLRPQQLRSLAYVHGALNESKDLVVDSFSERKAPERTQEVLQDWEGVVERIEDDIFVARLRDMTANEVYPGEIAELPVGDVSEDDRELLQVGAVFYMTVGYYVRASGRRERFGRVVFRRLPGWTASALERARERARRITHFLKPEG